MRSTWTIVAAVGTAHPEGRAGSDAPTRFAMDVRMLAMRARCRRPGSTVSQGSLHRCLPGNLALPPGQSASPRPGSRVAAIGSGSTASRHSVGIAEADTRAATIPPTMAAVVSVSPPAATAVSMADR